MNMVSYNENELPSLTAEQKANLQKLGMASDDDIDLSDIPEVTDWSNAIRGSLVPNNPNSEWQLGLRSTFLIYIKKHIERALQLRLDIL